MNEVADFTVANAGTNSNGHCSLGLQLVGLVLPALTSTTIGFQFSLDGSTWSTIYDRESTPAAVTLGGADTGSKTVAVPAEVARISACGWVRLVVAEQAAERAIKGLYARVES